jgi:hypothetical protein
LGVDAKQAFERAREELFEKFPEHKKDHTHD